MILVYGMFVFIAAVFWLAIIIHGIATLIRIAAWLIGHPAALIASVLLGLWVWHGAAGWIAALPTGASP